MKKTILTLLASVLLLTLCACADTAEQTAFPDPSEPSVTTIAVTTPTYTAATTTAPVTEASPDTGEPAPEPSAADLLLSLMAERGCPKDQLPTLSRELTVEELTAVKTFLADREALSVLGAATFCTPEEIRVYGILYAQIGKEAPASEQAAVVAKYGEPDWMELDCTKMTTAELDALLRKYTGVGMDASKKGEFVFYMEEYDAYYVFATDGYGVPADHLTGYLTADGDYLIRFGDQYDDRVSLLDVTDNGFLIRMMMELKGGLSAD